MKKIVFVIISTFILLFMLLFLVLPKEEFSVNENRVLESFPEFSFDALKNGEYINKLEIYINDHFAFRDFFVGLKTQVNKLLGNTLINGVYLGKDGYLLNKYEKTNQDKLIKILNNFKNNNPSKNINLIILPSSTSVYEEKLPKNAINDLERESIFKIYKSVSIKTIDVFNTLYKNKNKHHYTTYGAYYTYKEYCLNNNIEAIPLGEFDIRKVSSDFKGTLYSKVNDYKIKPDIMYLFLTNTNYEVNYADLSITKNSLYNYDYLNKKDKYSTFLDNNHGLIEITNKDIENDRELLVIKDSFGNSLVPFLSEHFKKVHVVDLRYNLDSITDYLKNNPMIKDVLIIYNITSLNETSSLYYLR